MKIATPLSLSSGAASVTLVPQGSWRVLIQLLAPDLNATTTVDTQLLGIGVEFFQDLAANWRGWVGERIWASIEGEFEWHAWCDSTGHVTLMGRIIERNPEATWSAEVSLSLEAGQLERLSRQIAEFGQGLGNAV